MPLGSAVFLVPAVLFLATLIRSALGFGEALVAVPLLAFLVPVKVAAPVAVMASITVALIVVVQDWRKVHARSVARLVLPTILGIPLGLEILRLGAEPVVKGVLAASIIGFSLFALLGGRHREWTDDRYAWLFGFGAGILGGAYGMNGPLLVIYGSLRRWSPQHFRATLQGYFLPASLLGLSGYRAAGLWTPTVTRFYLLSLPAVIAATFLGRAIHHRISPHRFTTYVHGGLIAIGVILLTQLAAQDRNSAAIPPSSRMADGKQWTTRNLDVPISPSYCYDGKEQNCRQYGRLYTWDSAQRACRSLGSGWRLPTDDEWRQLAKHYGAVSQDSEDKGKAAYQALLAGGSSGFNAVLGGGRSEDGQYARLEAHGFYWTASESGPAGGWYYNFGRGGLALHRQEGGERPRAFSVRCIRD
jgi:uncharacterized protein